MLIFIFIMYLFTLIQIFSLLIGSLILASLVQCDTDISAVMTNQNQHSGQSASNSIGSAELASEARQLPQAGSVSGSSGSVYPYNVYMNQPYPGYNGQPQTAASSGNGVLSFLKPQGGRRSFTSRIKNLMSSLFR